MTAPAGIPHQKHRGVPAEERRARRREQLLNAAIAVYGRVGFRNATVKAVCEAAGLTERYFYESFANSQALLVAAFEAVTERFHACLLAAAATVHQPGAAHVRAVLAEYFRGLAADPASARVFLVEIVGVGSGVDEGLDQRLTAFADLLERALGRTIYRNRHDAEGGGGRGLNRMAASWVGAGCDRSIDELVTPALKLCASLSHAVVASRSQRRLI